MTTLECVESDWWELEVGKVYEADRNIIHGEWHIFDEDHVPGKFHSCWYGQDDPSTGLVKLCGMDCFFRIKDD